VRFPSDPRAPRGVERLIQRPSISIFLESLQKAQPRAAARVTLTACRGLAYSLMSPRLDQCERVLEDVVRVLGQAPTRSFTARNAVRSALIKLAAAMAE